MQSTPSPVLSFDLIEGLSSAQIMSVLLLLAGAALLIRMTRNITVYALLALPGTALHESAHALVGLLLGAKPCSFSLLPKSLGNNRWQLGSVSFTRLRWWNAPWVAMAPLLLAPLAIWGALHYTAPAIESGQWLTAFGLSALGAVVLQAAWPSQKDLEVAFPGLLALGLVYVIFA